MILAARQRQLHERAFFNIFKPLERAVSLSPLRSRYYSGNQSGKAAEKLTDKWTDRQTEREGEEKPRSRAEHSGVT